MIFHDCQSGRACENQLTFVVESLWDSATMAGGQQHPECWQRVQAALTRHRYVESDDIWMQARCISGKFIATLDVADNFEIGHEQSRDDGPTFGTIVRDENSEMSFLTHAHHLLRHL
jgi:hypothetical protein